VAKASYIYKHYECNSLYCSWLLEYLVYKLPDNGVIVPKYVGVLIKYAIVYVTCAVVGLIQNISWIRMQGINNFKIDC
jgi:hypothetical protein